MLRSTSFKRSYRSGRDDIARDFLAPAMLSARRYDRASGYFTSGLLRYISTAVRGLVANGGKMRLVVSPYLDEQDVASIRRGYLERGSVIAARLESEVANFLASADDDGKSMLRELIRLHVLDIKVATTAVLSGIFHEKIGIFLDGLDSVAFTGSLNETVAGASINFESIDVFLSWVEPDRVREKIADFEALWNNDTPNINVEDFPESALRALSNGAPSPSGLRPAVSLRSYQEGAVAAWDKAGRRGILSMATGSGKTITAISAIASRIAERPNTVVTILAPYKHLVEQWAAEVTKLLSVTVVQCHSSNDWRSDLQRLRMRQALGAVEPVIMVATYLTAQGQDFIAQVDRLQGHRLIVADEVHNITLENADQILLPIYVERLALSATPRRFRDEAGTERIEQYFGGVVFEYTLEEAIRDGALTPYVYRPIVCTLTPTEQIEYDRIMADADGTDRDILLLSKRNALLETSLDKLNKFEEAFSNSRAVKQGHSLVYVHHELLDIVMSFVGGTLGVFAHRFTARETLDERREILARFVSGELKVLVAIRCLDEGVDIPSVHTAFLLNSSSNPKEFVQRRGRVLRRYVGKTEATIYDFVVLPRAKSTSDEALLQKELARFMEFARLAKNSKEAQDVLQDFARQIDLSLPDSL
jgi:superfamily II DNA or RNA helicase